jgi:hypothetical protein
MRICREGLFSSFSSSVSTSQSCNLAKHLPNSIGGFSTTTSGFLWRPCERHVSELGHEILGLALSYDSQVHPMSSQAIDSLGPSLGSPRDY